VLDLLKPYAFKQQESVLVKSILV